MDDISAFLLDLAKRVGDLERQRGFQSRTGVIEAVDAGRGVARVRLLDGDTPFLTGWLPWEEAAAGANKTHNPPSAGQQVRIHSESGDLQDASIQASLNSSANGRPSGAGDEFILASVGEASIRIKGGGSVMVLKVGPSTITLDAGRIVINGPQVFIN